MGIQSLDHQEADPNTIHHRSVEDQAPVHELHSAFSLQRCRRMPPEMLGPAGLLVLQSTVGNRAVQRLVTRAQTGRGCVGVIQRRWNPPELQGQIQSIADARTHDGTVWNHYTFESRSDDPAVPPMRFDDSMWSTEEGARQEESGSAGG